MHITIDSIKQYFEFFNRSIQASSALTQAAVLILLFNKNNQLHIVFTKRTEDVQHHKGEVSFPGGTKDDKDDTIIATALREAEEEIGLSKKNVEVLGLHNDFITPSGFCITPVVGFIPSIINININTSEVAEVFDVPLPFFLNNQNEKVAFHIFDGIRKPIYHYSFGDYEIWGATAAMLRSFLIDLTNKLDAKRLCKSGNS